jgi:hypothetical protein
MVLNAARRGKVRTSFRTNASLGDTGCEIELAGVDAHSFQFGRGGEIICKNPGMPILVESGTWKKSSGLGA